MNAIIYVAVAQPLEGGGYTATFPDLPQCSVSGADPAELLAHARAALRAELQARADRAEDWPNASRIEHVQVQAPQFTLLVDVEVDDPPVRVNISIGEQLLKKLDAAAEAAGSTRSGFIAQAIRERLGERRGSADFDAAARRFQEELGVLGRKINESLGPDSAFSRTMAEFDDRLSDAIRKAADNVSAAMARRREADARARRSASQDAAAEL